MDVTSVPAPQPAESAADAAPSVLRREEIGEVAILTLNRPAARNALSESLLASLGAALVAISEDRRIRAVVLAAEGAAFSAGHDLKELSARRNDNDGGRAYFKQMMEGCSAVMQMIVRLPQPVTAAVEGVATAAGCQLVASCDLAVASQSARFATPGVDIGLFCSTPMVALSRNIGRKQAMQMLLTGEMIGADEALRIGLVNRVVEPGRAREAALKLAGRVAQSSPAVIKLGKEAFYRQTEMDLAGAYGYASEVMVENMMAPDAEEGISAFLEKRTPQWPPS